MSEKEYFLLQCDRCYNGRDKTWRLKTHLFPSSLGGDQPIEKVQVDLLPEDAWDVLETSPENIVLKILFRLMVFYKQDLLSHTSHRFQLK